MPSEEELLSHLQAISGLDQARLAKLVDEVRAWYGQDLAGWVRQRHRELQQQGMRNREIYPRIRAETERILVRPSALSVRQIRRIIYG